eukprot:4761369-Alexandrium_andersonii.AAC.1
MWSLPLEELTEREREWRARQPGTTLCRFSMMHASAFLHFPNTGRSNYEKEAGGKTGWIS